MSSQNDSIIDFTHLMVKHCLVFLVLNIIIVKNLAVYNAF